MEFVDGVAQRGLYLGPQWEHLRLGDDTLVICAALCNVIDAFPDFSKFNDLYALADV